VVLSCSALLLVAAIALPLGNDGFGLAPPIGGERLAGTYLLVRELTLLIAPYVTLVTFVRLDRLS
jgi:hypothetical protein